MTIGQDNTTDIALYYENRRSGPPVILIHGRPLCRAKTWNLDEVHDTLESWPRVAWLVSEHGHEGYRRMMAQAQETPRTGQSHPAASGSTRSRR